MKAILVSLLALIVLVACGGGGGDGGGGGGGGGGGNNPPVADAGPDQIVTIGHPVDLDGRGSSDLDGDALTYSWVFTEYPSADPPVLDDSTSATPSFLVTQDGEYFITLTVNDSTEDSFPSEVRIVAFLPRPDDFERPEGSLSAAYSWGYIDPYPSFTIDSLGSNKVARPTSNAIHVNFWNQEFDKNQWVSFTIAKKPEIINESSVGALLRGDIEAQEGYLVTFVPQDGVDTIRVWKVIDEFDTGADSAILIQEILFEYLVDDRVTIFVFEENDGRHFIEVKIDRGNDEFLLVPIEISDPDDIIDRGGYIGIYAVTNSGNVQLENVGAIDNFNGGNISN